jgi:hypothetical protein
MLLRVVVTAAAALLTAFAGGPKLSASGLDFSWSLLPSLIQSCRFTLTRGAWSILNIAAERYSLGSLSLIAMGETERWNLY